MMTRRGFLQLLGMTAVAVVAAPVLVEEVKPVEEPKPPKREIRRIHGKPVFFDVSFVFNPYVPMVQPIELAKVA